ncbi:MAG: ankyrin repeat domain-containing protein [Chromatiales bacterium]|nr:ankyrin repeat domain-containing protein [Chromatiales bacterium]
MTNPDGIACRTREELRALWFWTAVAGAVFLGLLAAMVAALVTDAPDGVGEPVDSADVVAMAVLGAAWLALVVHAVRRTVEWRALGEARLVVGPRRPTLGETLVARVRFERAPARIGDARAELTCVETWTEGHGKKRTERREVRWRGEARPPVPGTLEFRFDLPAAIPTGGHFAHSVHWWLAVRGGGSQRFRRRFRLLDAADERLAPAATAVTRRRRPSGPDRLFNALVAFFGALCVLALAAIGWWLVGEWRESESVATPEVELVLDAPVALSEADGEAGLDRGDEPFAVEVDLSVPVRLGRLRRIADEPLVGEATGVVEWSGRRVEVAIEAFTAVRAGCDGACPPIRAARVELMRWSEDDTETQHGVVLARSDPLELDVAPVDGEAVELPAHRFAMRLARVEDPRRAALLLVIESDDRETTLGTRFGGAAHWVGLDRSPGDPAACQRLQGVVAALDHFCHDRFVALLAGVESEAARRRLAFLATRRGNADALQALIAAGVAVDVTNARGYTPLMESAFADLPDLVELLIAAGADPRFQARRSSDAASETALGAGIVGGSLDSVEILLAAGADPTTSHDDTPLLHLAAIYDLPDAIDPLAARGAPVDARAGWGDRPTALMVAAGVGNLTAVERLLGRGADLAARDDAGHTARDYAATHGRRVTLERLRDAPGACPLTGCGQ